MTATLTQSVKEKAPSTLRKGSKEYRKGCKVIATVLGDVILDRIPSAELEGLTLEEATKYVMDRLDEDGVLAEVSVKDVPPLEDIVEKALKKRVFTRLRPTTE